MAYKLIGKNFTPPDVLAKVTGKAKYAEDFRAEGMVFCKLLLSPMPHARVKNIDASAALKMQGRARHPDRRRRAAVPAAAAEPILTNDADSSSASRSWRSPPSTRPPRRTRSRRSRSTSSRCRTSSIRSTACIRAARTRDATGNVANAADQAADRQVDGARLRGGRAKASCPWASPPRMDLRRSRRRLQGRQAGARRELRHGRQLASLMEPRTAMAYWQNGKCFLHGSTPEPDASWCRTSRATRHRARRTSSSSPNSAAAASARKGTAYPVMAIPAHMSKKIGRPVHDAHHPRRGILPRLGARRLPGPRQARLPRRRQLIAADLYVVQRERPEHRLLGLPNSAGDALSLVYQPPAMRWRGDPGARPTRRRAGRSAAPARTSSRCAMEPMIDKAARAARRRPAADPPDQRARQQRQDRRRSRSR